MKKPRLMVIGLDSVSLTLLDKFKKHCPTIRRVMKQGATGRAISVLPVYTPTNWAALATGADTTRTFAAGWRRTVNGESLSTFHRRAVPCDTIFDSASRAGLKTLAICYPLAWPALGRNNRVLVPLDRGLVSNCLVPGKVVETRFDREGVFRFALLSAPGAATGAAQAKAVGATEDGAELTGKARRTAVGTIEAFLHRVGAAKWRLGLASGRASARIELKSETWSAPIPVRVATSGRPGKCVVRVMVFDGGRRLAVSEAYDVGMLGAPASLARTVFEKLGPPTEHSVLYNEFHKLFDKGVEDKTITRLALEDMTAQADWVVAAAALVQKIAPYDVFYLHHHYPDDLNHFALAALEGVGRVKPKQRTLARAAFASCIEICDRLVAGLLRLAGPETTVLLVSDHGEVPNFEKTSPLRRLINAGLTRLDASGGVDRRRSLAWIDPRVGTWIEVNAPRSSRRYERIQAKVIDLLLDWKTPKGERVISVAVRRKDSHVLGYEGEHCGDVTFHFNSGFSWFGDPKRELSGPGGANHGPQMPATFSKMSDNLAFFAMKGPRVRRGLRRDEERHGLVRIVDLVPTACAASGVPTPLDATGSPRHDLLKD